MCSCFQHMGEGVKDVIVCHLDFRNSSVSSFLQQAGCFYLNGASISSNEISCTLFLISLSLSPLISAKPFESGQYLDIYGITRDQAGEYECSAENDVSVPDVKKVKVTVNCKLHVFWRGGNI